MPSKPAAKKVETPKPTDQPAADEFHPRQTILSLPLHVTHPRQTLIQPSAPAEPPRIVTPLPNIVQWPSQELAKPKTVSLKVGVMCTIAPTHLTELIGSIQTRYPAVELELTDSNAVELQQSLIEGDIEVAIYALPGDANERLHVLPLYREQMMIVLSAKHRLAGKNAVIPQDLNGEKYINRINCEFNGYVMPQLDNVEFKTVFRSERDDWILAMIAANAGFGFMAESSVNYPGVVARPVIEPEFWRDVNLVTVRGRPHSPAVGALVREAMRIKWHGAPPIAVSKAMAKLSAEDAGAMH